jgi:hypothetical protein
MFWTGAFLANHAFLDVGEAPEHRMVTTTDPSKTPNDLPQKVAVAKRNPVQSPDPNFLFLSFK